MKSVLAGLLLTTAIFASTTPAQAAMVENYFQCTLNEGKSWADATKFVRAYQAAIREKWPTYDVKILMPVYTEYRGPGKFVWYGAFDSADMHDISEWFRTSEWVPKFQELTNCGGSSLWRRID